MHPNLTNQHISKDFLHEFKKKRGGGRVLNTGRPLLFFLWPPRSHTILLFLRRSPPLISLFSSLSPLPLPKPSILSISALVVDSCRKTRVSRRCRVSWKGKGDTQTTVRLGILHSFPLFLSIHNHVLYLLTMPTATQFREPKGTTTR